MAPFRSGRHQVDEILWPDFRMHIFRLSCFTHRSWSGRGHSVPSGKATISLTQLDPAHSNRRPASSAAFAETSETSGFHESIVSQQLEYMIYLVRETEIAWLRT